MMRRRKLLRAVAGGLCVAAVRTRAQPAGRVPVVGFLFVGSMETLAQFRDAMRDFGHVEGRTYLIVPRSSEGRPEKLPGLAAELVRLNVDVLYASGPAAVKAAKSATGIISIVAFDLETDPVATGLVRSLGRPGGNITGLFLNQPTLAGKLLELLGQAAPGRKRVGVLWDATTGTAQLAAARSAAQRLGIELQILEIRAEDELDKALRSALVGNVQAIMVLSSPLAGTYSKRFAEFATQHRLPSISLFRTFADRGGLLSYGPDLLAFRRFAATYVERILKGAKPADLPIQQPFKFELVVNLKTAKSLGLTIPQSLLLRADEVIQ